MSAKNLSVSEALYKSLKKTLGDEHPFLKVIFGKSSRNYQIKKKDLFKNHHFFTEEQLITLCDENNGLRLLLRNLETPVVVPQSDKRKSGNGAAPEHTENEKEVVTQSDHSGGSAVNETPVISEESSRQQLSAGDSVSNTSGHSYDALQQEKQIAPQRTETDESAPAHAEIKKYISSAGVKGIAADDTQKIPEEKVPAENEKTEVSITANSGKTVQNSEEAKNGEPSENLSQKIDTPKNKPLTGVKPKVVPLKEWVAASHAVAGRSHLRVYPPVPCQDEALAVGGQYPAVIVCDGAGSSPLSHIGAVKVAEGLALLVSALAPLNSRMLDDENGNQFSEKEYVTIWIKFAVETIRQLSRQLAHPFSAFRSTLLLAIAGKKRIFWLQLGDGNIVFEQDGRLRAAAPPVKGEYANETSFLAEQLNSSDFNFGFEKADGISGIVAFTDGAGERLVSNDGSKIAGRLGNMLENLRSGKLNGDDIRKFLTESEVWAGTSGDDKSIAMIAPRKN